MSGNAKPGPKSAFYGNPGPGAYRLPPLVGRPNHAVTHQIGPEYTMRPGFTAKVAASPGPGVGKHVIDLGLKANEKVTGPEFTFGSRLDPKNPPEGAGAHTLPPLDLHSPPFTFRQQTPSFDRNKSPRPNAYTLPPLVGPRVPNKTVQEEVSMKGRPGFQFADKMIGPGPGAYPPILPDVVKPKAPEISLGTTGASFNKKDPPKCGPGSYDPTRKVYPEPPAYTFGIRFLWTGIMISVLICSRSVTSPTWSQTQVSRTRNNATILKIGQRENIYQNSDSRSMASATTTWLTVDDLEFQVASTLDMHVHALLWAVSSIVLGFLVLAFDTREDHGQTRRGIRIRDHILGIEQRYFLIILNGILLYGALVVKIQKIPPLMIVPR